MKNFEYKHSIKFILIPSIPLFIISLLPFYYPNMWISTPIDHIYIELFGTILASILAFYYISTGYVLTNRFSMFIGIGFLVNCLIDVLHVIVSLTNMYDVLFLKYFIPQTWFAGKFFLSAMLMIAIIKFPHLVKTKIGFEQENLSNLKSDKIERHKNIQSKNKKNSIPKTYDYIILSLLIIFSLFLSLGSLFMIFPFSVLDDFPIHRIYELVPLAFFVIALIYFYKNKIYQENDILYTSLLLFLVINFFGQIIMAISATSHDTAHNLAHFLKDASYFVAIIGLSLSNLSYNIQLRKSNEIIKEQYLKLQESEKLKEEFINIAAHELRNPIQPIMGLSTIMLREIADTRNKEYLQSILKNSKRLNSFIENMLDVAKIQNNLLKINKKIVNLNILISQIIKEYTPQLILQDKKIYFDFKTKKEDLIIKADPDRLKQVISNLLENSLNFTNSGDSITIIVEQEKEIKEGRKKERKAIRNKRDGQTITVSVIDTGDGINPEIFHNLFSKFNTKNSVKGSGLGLYISKKIIEAHGGIIWAENPLSKKGAIFKFTLPIQD
ncbi:MAG: ATP-binding protein [Nitrososphaeraceae archaeon]|nr:ATP-binding protein [Nitrososphaeraceae archaeon]